MAISNDELYDNNTRNIKTPSIVGAALLLQLCEHIEGWSIYDFSKQQMKII